jgi:hypothetical protein
MSITPLTSEPASITAGDTISWTIALPDYPATAGWTLKYKAVCAAGYFAMVSSADGDNHIVTADKATTAAYVAGSYTLSRYVESATERVTIDNLTLEVLPDLAAKTAAYDNRSHTKKTLDAIEAVLEGRASIDQQEWTVDGTTIKRMPVADLLKFRSIYFNYYQQELTAAKIASGSGSGSGKIRVRL